MKNAAAAGPNRDPIPTEQQEAQWDAVGEELVFTEALSEVEFRNVFVAKAFLGEFARRNQLQRLPQPHQYPDHRVGLGVLAWWCTPRARGRRGPGQRPRGAR